MNQNLLRVGDEVWYDRSTSSWSTSYTRGIVLALKLDRNGSNRSRPDHVRVRRLREDGSEWNYPADDDGVAKPVIDLVHARKVDDLWVNKQAAIEAARLRDEWSQRREADEIKQREWLEEAFKALNINLRYEGGRLKLAAYTHDEAPTEQGTRAGNYNHNVSWIHVANHLAKKLKVKLPVEPEVIWEHHPDFLDQGEE